MPPVPAGEAMAPVVVGGVGGAVEAEVPLAAGAASGSVEPRRGSSRALEA